MAEGLWLVDIDGTVAERGSAAGARGPFDWERIHEDTPNAPVVAVVRALTMAGHDIAYVTGRPERCRRATVTWLRRHVGSFDQALGLWMRGNGDRRKDTIVKAEIFRAHFAHRPVMGVIEDRAGVVRMWRELGLTVLQCKEGDY